MLPRQIWSSHNSVITEIRQENMTLAYSLSRLLKVIVADTDWLVPDGAADSARRLYENCPQMTVKRNNGHLITLQIGMPFRYHVWGWRMKLFWNLYPKPKTVTEIKSLTGKDMGQFSAGPINKAVPSFRNSLTREREGWRKTFWAFFSTQKVFKLAVFALSWIVETIFDNMSTVKLPWLKVA